MVNIKKIRDSATEKLRKSGYEVRYVGFSFGKGGNSIEEAYVLRHEGKSHIASIEYGPNGSNLTVLPQNETTSQVKKDVIVAFQNQ